MYEELISQCHQEVNLIRQKTYLIQNDCVEEVCQTTKGGMTPLESQLIALKESLTKLKESIVI